MYVRLITPITPIVKPHQEEAVRTHRYVGDNNSIFYNYVINPFCNFTIEYFPKWLA